MVLIAVLTKEDEWEGDCTSCRNSHNSLVADEKNEDFTKAECYAQLSL